MKKTASRGKHLFIKLIPSSDFSMDGKAAASRCFRRSQRWHEARRHLRNAPHVHGATTTFGASSTCNGVWLLALATRRACADHYQRPSVRWIHFGLNLYQASSKHADAAYVCGGVLERDLLLVLRRPSLSSSVVLSVRNMASCAAAACTAACLSPGGSFFARRC